MNRVIKEKIKQGSTLFVIVIAFMIVISIMIKYDHEGETIMPFKLSEMLIVSSADGESMQDNPNNNRWNLNINQYNDIYLQFEKNDDYVNNAYIKDVTIENIIATNPKIGKVMFYMPNSLQGKLFSYEDNYLINGSLTYNGSTKDNTRTLEIANQGGMFVFRAVNMEVSKYISNDNDEVTYDGTLLKRASVNIDDVKFSISFDIVITTDTNKYRGKVDLDLPCGDIENDGTSKIYDRDFKNVVFKRDNT